MCNLAFFSLFILRSHWTVLRYTTNSHHNLNAFILIRLIPSTFQLIPKGFWRSFFCEEQFFRQQVEMINLMKLITMQCSTTQSSFFPFFPFIRPSLPSTFNFQPFQFPNVFLSTIHIHLPLSYPILSHPNLLLSPGLFSVDC